MGVEHVRRLLEELEERLRLLGEEEERLRALLASIPAAGGGTLDYRWVKGADKSRKYWYWYRIYYKNGRRYHQYIGKTLKLEHLGGATVEDLERAKYYARMLRRVASARVVAERRLARAEALIDEALARVEGALVGVEAVA